MTVLEIDRLVRAVTHPYPGAFFDVGNERTVVWAGRMCKVDGALPITALDGTYWATNIQKQLITQI